MEDVYKLYKDLATQYNLSSYDTRKLWNIIKPICEHKEFIKRCNAPFFHHDIKTLGEHILTDTIVTYRITKRLKTKLHKQPIKLELAIYIAMFHDLYEIPWQNSFQHKKFKNLHGFIHPIEAVVNAITWYPDYFRTKENSLIIIDGIIHHMFPLPVRAIDESDLQLNVIEKYNKLPDKYKKMIKASTSIGKFGPFSLRKSFFIEGRIMSKADKRVAITKDLKEIHGYIALIDGRNKKVAELNKKVKENN